jgi:hypothetical protein
MRRAGLSLRAIADAMKAEGFTLSHVCEEGDQRRDHLLFLGPYVAGDSSANGRGTAATRARG